jgi:hypothetical protein
MWRNHEGLTVCQAHIIHTPILRTLLAGVLT